MENTKRKDFWKIGFSSAASWAWGTSLIMGQQIAQERGLIAWIIWAVCNSLTLALFAWLYNKNIIKKEFCERKEVKIIALIIQVFCLLVQLNFINQQFYIIIGNPIISYIITALIGILFTMIVLKKGLPTSIKTDVVQWGIAIVSIFVILGVALIGNAPLMEFVPTSSSGVLWGIWGGLVLFAGPIGDVQHWQRAESDTSKKGYYFGAVLFAIYMCQILGMACFEFNIVMNVILLITVLCVTTSTIDSIAVALHKVGNKYVGTGVAIFMCLAFGLFVKMGMIDLWSSFGIIRFAFAIGIIILPLCEMGKWKITIPTVLATLTTIIVFSILGQVKLLSIAGIISFIVVLVILTYLTVISIKRAKENIKISHYRK